MYLATQFTSTKSIFQFTSRRDLNYSRFYLVLVCCLLDKKMYLVLADNYHNYNCTLLISVDLLDKNFQKHQLNTKRFPAFPEPQTRCCLFVSNLLGCICRTVTQVQHICLPGSALLPAHHVTFGASLNTYLQGVPLNSQCNYIQIKKVFPKPHGPPLRH